MRIETLETRIVFDQSLGSAIEFDIDTSVDIGQEQEPVTIPADVQFRPTDDDFRYESAELDPNVMDELVAATEEWADNPVPWQTFRLTDTEAWRKTIRHNPVSIHDDGYVIAERIDSDADAHTLLTIQKLNSDCFLHGGLYTRPDYHYRYSFDVRLPDSERSWLEKADGNWAIVTQLWGPREDGEVILEPPFSIYTYVEDGQPYWVVRSIGDADRITTPGGADFYETERIPMTGIGEWHNFDIEFVPNAHGQGVVKTWLDGELVAEWVDVKSAYSAQSNGVWTGPLNPAFGLYSYNNADGQEAHFDNMILHCNGAFESSISGRITGSDAKAGVAVYATNVETGEKYGTYTEKSGVYVLGVPSGEYTITAVEEATERIGHVAEVSTQDVSSLVVDVAISDVEPVPTSVPGQMTLTGDVNGDGVTDVLNLLADGSWQVTVMNSSDDVVQSLGRRIPGVNIPPVDEILNTPTEETPTDSDPAAEPTDPANEESPQDPADSDPVTDPPTDPVDEPAAEEPATEEPTTEPPATEEPAAEEPTPVDPVEQPSLPTDPEPEVRAPVKPGPVTTSVWTSWSSDTQWTDVHIADFNGDGLDDIVGRDATTGAWHVSVSTGQGFQDSVWGSWTVGIEWMDVLVGDFNGDGRADIAGRAASNGSWWIASSTGDRFQNTEWGRWSLKIDWEMVVGDFNGDGMDDIAGRASTDGTWWIGQSTGSRFQNSYWGRFTNKVTWSEFVVGDFNGDGLSDIAARAEADGTFWVAESTGSGFLNRYWGRWTNAVDWLDIALADVDGNGTTDIVGRASSDGSWWVAKSTGQKFQSEYWGAVWNQDVDWLTAVVEDFDGDGTTDLLGVNSESWWLSV